jgi:formate--tetrahydrofolate ligase
MAISTLSYQAARMLGLEDKDLQLYGDFAVKLDHRVGLRESTVEPKVLPPLINITAITPTPHGEGKTTVAIGLVDALRARGVNAIGTLRQSSLGPTLNLKGAGIGGGRSQCVPQAPLILGLTGDFDRIATAQNLGMTALTARICHEDRYDDHTLAAKGLRRLGIDSARLSQSWAIDLCAQALRQINMSLPFKGREGHADSGFVMTSAAEVMTIFSLAQSLGNLREMLGRMEFAKDSRGNPVTADDLEVAGAMAGMLHSAFDPNLVVTAEGSPMLMHSGPFANISIGNSSIIADLCAASLGAMVVTESGFGSDVGFEKMWSIKAQRSPLQPRVAVIVVSVRALRFHSLPRANSLNLKSGKGGQHLGNVADGLWNLRHHLGIVAQSGVPAIVCLNYFDGDTHDEIAVVERCCADAKVPFVVAKHFSQGSLGALDLADAVVEMVRQPTVPLRPSPSLSTSIEARVKGVVNSIYGMREVSFADQFRETAELELKSRDLTDYQICMCKTPYSFSHNPKLGQAFSDAVFEVHGLLLHHGAKLLIPVCGEVNLLPGTISTPNFREIDIGGQDWTLAGL